MEGGTDKGKGKEGRGRRGETELVGGKKEGRLRNGRRRKEGEGG